MIKKKKSPPGRTGAIGKYNPETVKRIIDSITDGNYYSVAYTVGGITKETFFKWIKKFPDFSDQVRIASAEAHSRMVNMVSKAASVHWQAAAWYLDRKHNKQWGSKQRLEHSGKIGRGGVDYTPDEARAMFEIEMKRLKRENGDAEA